MNDRYDKWLADIDRDNLSLFIARYEYWLTQQLKNGGLVFTPSDYWNSFEQNNPM